MIAEEGDESVFHVVLGAPTELLAMGEMPAVEVSGGRSAYKGIRLLAGQFFGERGFMRQLQAMRRRGVHVHQYVQLCLPVRAMQNGGWVCCRFSERIWGFASNVNGRGAGGDLQA